MHPVKSMFEKSAGLNVIRKDFLAAGFLGAIQASNWLFIKKTTGKKVSVVETVTLQVRTSY